MNSFLGGDVCWPEKRQLKSKLISDVDKLYCAKCGTNNPDDATFCQSCGNSLKVAGSGSAPPPGSAPPSGPPPTSPLGAPSQPPAATFSISDTFKNAFALVMGPGAFLRANKDVVPPLRSIMINYVAVLAVIPFIGTLIGDLWYYGLFGFAGFAVVEAIVTYILDVIGVFVVGLVIWKLGPSFGTVTNQAKATMMAAYVYTPAFLISILNIIPFISWITILGLLYGLYILYIGLPIVLGTPADKVIVYVVVTVVVTLVIYAIFGAIIGAITAAFFLSAFFPFF